MNTPDLLFYKISQNVQSPRYATESSSCFDLYAYLPEEKNVLGTMVRVFDDYPRSQIDRFQPHHNPVHLNEKPSDRLVPVENGELVLRSSERALIPTGIIFDIPNGYSVRIHPRSGLSLSFGMTLANCEGVVDEDYVEEVCIIVINLGRATIKIRNGDRICQAELVKDSRSSLKQIDSMPSIKTSRNGGFGSTGI